MASASVVEIVFVYAKFSMGDFECICYFSSVPVYVIHSLLLAGIIGGLIGKHAVLDMFAFTERRHRQWAGRSR